MDGILVSPHLLQLAVGGEGGVFLGPISGRQRIWSGGHAALWRYTSWGGRSLPGEIDVGEKNYEESGCSVEAVPGGCACTEEEC